MRTRPVSLLLAVSAVLMQGIGAAAASPASSGCAKASFTTGARLERSIEIGGVTRNYILHVPQSAQPGRPAAVLLDFHGWGHSAAGVWRVSQFKDLAERDGFITIYPDGLPVSLRPGETRPGWEILRVDGNRDLVFVNAVLDRLEEEYCVDRARVYSTGFSNGAFFSHILGCIESDRIAAIAPVGGGRITVPCRPDRPVPVLIYHGMRDELIPAASARQARDEWARLNGCGQSMKAACELYRCTAGVEVRYCEVDIGHTWPPQATDEIWAFLKRYALTETSTSGSRAALSGGSE